jgi:hypothetical protein
MKGREIKQWAAGLADDESVFVVRYDRARVRDRIDVGVALTDQDCDWILDSAQDSEGTDPEERVWCAAEEWADEYGHNLWFHSEPLFVPGGDQVINPIDKRADR